MQVLAGQPNVKNPTGGRHTPNWSAGALRRLLYYDCCFSSGWAGLSVSCVAGGVQAKDAAVEGT